METRLDPPPFWAGDGITIWVARLDLTPSDRQILCHYLSADEREQVSRYRLPQMASAFVVRRGLLRVLLGQELNRPPGSLRFMREPQGKPALVSGERFFSVSSSRDYAAWAISSKLPVGIDIEWLDFEMPFSPIIDDHFSLAEKKRLDAIPNVEEHAHAFFRAWTLKEACAKATGNGLAAPLNRYAVLDSRHGHDALSEIVIMKSLQIPSRPAKAAYQVSFALARHDTPPRGERASAF